MWAEGVHCECLFYQIHLHKKNLGFILWTESFISMTPQQYRDAHHEYLLLFKKDQN